MEYEAFKVISISKYYGEDNEDYWTINPKSAKSFLCDRIEYHTPVGEGDQHYCDVYKGNDFIRVFNPSKIEFRKVEQE